MYTVWTICMSTPIALKRRPKITTATLDGRRAGAAAAKYGTASDAVLKTANALFYRSGFSRVSVDDIARAAGVTKRTLYYHFPSKAALIEAYLSQRDESSRFWLISEASKDRRQGTERLAGVFAVLAQWFQAPDFNGCAFQNAASVWTEFHDAVLPHVFRHKESIRDWMMLEASHTLASDPRQLADQLMLIFDGAIAGMMTRKDPAIAASAQIAAATLLRASGAA